MTPIEEVSAELERAIQKFPTWPVDPLHALAVLGEEYGELNKAMLQLIYEPHKTSAGAVRKEAIQTAAMAVRLVANLDIYQYKRYETTDLIDGQEFDGEVDSNRTILLQIRKYFEEPYRSKLFITWNEAFKESSLSANTAGIRRMEGNNSKPCYYVFNTAFARICAPFDPHEVGELLLKHRWIKSGHDGTGTYRMEQLPCSPIPVACYVFTTRMWQDNL